MTVYIGNMRTCGWWVDITFPTEAQVEAPVQFGVDPDDLTGTLVAGGAVNNIEIETLTVNVE